MHEQTREWSQDDLSELHRDTIDYLDGVAADARLLIAQQCTAIADILRDAPREAALWVGPDPSTDASWQPPGGMTFARWRRERAEFAVRSAVAELAVRLHVSETAIRSRATVVDTLRERCPRVWRRFTGGSVVEQNAATAAQYAQALPEDPEVWGAFDAAVVDGAVALTPARFRTRARVVRERVHAESITARHARAAADRGVWVTPESDGMATVTAFIAAADAEALGSRLDTAARHLRAAAGEERTLAQVRADAFVDLLVHGTTADVTATMQAAVAVTVPVLTLLGASNEPATLDDYGPIDLDTARRLAGAATSWTRVLTHPVTGTVLDVDRTKYRPPADLRRYVERMHPTCAFPGCGRASRLCELDHKNAWTDGGGTSKRNLHPLCRPHHRVRHGTAWAIDPDPAGSGHSGRTRWRTPTGLTTDSDPPPF